MIPETFLDNLQSWAIQVFVIASIGAVRQGTSLIHAFCRARKNCAKLPLNRL